MGTASTPRELAQWLGRNDLTLEDLVAAASELLPSIAPRQTRYKVSQRPDARTVRYYISQNLLPRPLSYEGGRARYGGSHLLRLLLIKRLQAEHVTLRRIARVLGSLSDAELPAALGRTEPPRQAEEPVTPARQAPAALASSHRLELAPGGVVEVPDEVLRDPARRSKLAANLEALARWLRSSAERPDPGEAS